jgi:hypothetical protein
MANKISEEDYTKMVIEKVEKNHIWLNKMNYLFATDEQKIALANIILDKLKCKTTQLPSHCIADEDEGMRELAELTPILYLSINWS